MSQPARTRAVSLSACAGGVAREAEAVRWLARHPGSALIYCGRLSMGRNTSITEVGDKEFYGSLAGFNGELTQEVNAMKTREAFGSRAGARIAFLRLLATLAVITFCANAAIAAGKSAAVDAKALVVGSTVIEKVRKTGMDIQAYYSDDGNAYAHFDLKGQERAAIVPYYFKGNKVCQHFRGPEVCVQFVKQKSGYVTVHDSGKIGSDVQIKKGDVYGLAPHVKEAQQEHQQMKTQQEELADRAVEGLKAVWGLLTQRPPTPLEGGRYECQNGQVVMDPSAC